MVKLEAECALSTFQGERNGLQDLWDVGPSLRAWWANVSRAGAWLSWLTCRLWLSPGAAPYLLILQSPSFFRLSAVVFWGTNSGAAGGANRQGNGAKAMGLQASADTLEDHGKKGQEWETASYVCTWGLAQHGRDQRKQTLHEENTASLVWSKRE